MRRRAKYYIGGDFGGTIGKIARVEPATGEFLSDITYVDLNNETENSEVSKKIIQKIRELSPPDMTIGLGLCAAGDSDEKELIIKKAPNSRVKGILTFPKDLRNAGYDVVFSNDMVAAVQDSATYGEGRNLENVCTATYSEGHNAAAVRERKNVTWAEIGHHLYKQDGELYCGCGERGHLEPYVSARGAAVMAIEFFLMTNIRKHPVLENVVERVGANPQILKNDDIPDVIFKITAKDVYQAYREYPEQEPQSYIRETQVEAIKYSFGVMNSFWNPLDIIVCIGGQTLDKDILFYGKDGAITRYRTLSGVQLDSLKKPKVVITDRKETGISGAVANYISKRE